MRYNFEDGGRGKRGLVNEMGIVLKIHDFYAFKKTTYDRQRRVTTFSVIDPPPSKRKNPEKAQKH